MSCFRAIGGGISFSRAHSTGLDTTIRCGQCVGCRISRARSWAVRLYHEAQLHDNSSFITLTYNPESIPENGSLDKADHQRFIRRLRKRLKPARVRYFLCGEYGEETLRPHYHLALFGHSYPDRVYLSTTDGGSTLYRSPTLESDWSVDNQPLGHAVIGDLTFESAQYIALYATKKLNVSKASRYRTQADHETAVRAFEQRYQRVHPDTGEIVQIEREYLAMSSRPSPGRRWFERYWKDVFPSDFLIINGTRHAVPRYYDKLLESWGSNLPLAHRPKSHTPAFFRELFESVKKTRLLNRDNSDDSEERLTSLERVTLARQNLYGARDT